MGNIKAIQWNFILALFLLASGQTYAQTTIWLEDFPYADGTTVGSGTPSKWTRDVSACNLGTGDYFEVRSNEMAGRDLDGEAVWTTESIDISSYSDVTITIDASESGNLGNQDYIRFYYKIDGGTETLFETNGSLVNDFTSAVASQTQLNGDSLVIVVRVKNNGNRDIHYFDNVWVVVIPYPANDDCANALVVGEVTDLPFTTTYATASGENPGCGGATDPMDIWYSYTPSENGSATFDLCGSNFDTRLAIWDACGGNVLDCNDDDDYCGTGTLQSLISMEVTSGTTYYVQVGGYNALSGTGDFTISFIPESTNDDCASATAIGEVTDLIFSTIGATAGGDNPGCGGGTDPVDIWYAYTATASGIAYFDLCESSYDTRLAIWDACSGNVLECNDDGNYCPSHDYLSFISMAVVSGTTYYVQVAGYNALTGNGVLTIAVYPYPTNDACSNAIAINEVSDMTYSTIAATASGVNPGCGGTTNPKDIWYAYTATSTGSAQFDLCGSTYNTRLAIYDACGGNLLDCNDDDDYCGSSSEQSSITMSVTSGITYYLQVSGYNDLTGNGDLTIVVVPISTNDDCASATAIGEVTDLVFTTNGATAGGDNPGCGGTTNPIDIWYAYTPTVTGIAQFDLCGSSFDTRLAIWSACSGSVLACNDDDDYCGGGSSQSYISMAVTSGTTYYVQVAGYEALTGNGDLSISVIPYPTNDECSTATTVGEVTDQVFTTNGATSSGSNPGCGGSNAPIDIWFSYSPTSSGDVLFDLCGSTFNTRLAIYDACGGNILACNDDNGPGCTGTNASIELTVSSANTYYIQVGGNEIAVGNGDLSITLTASLVGQWTGVIDNDWGTQGNWVDGIIPTSWVDAKIINNPPNYPEVDETANCYNLTIGVDDSLTVNSGASLSAEGDLFNNGFFIMNNGSYTISGNLNSSATSLSDFNGGTLSMNGWHENGPSSAASGVVELSGGTINVTNDVSMTNSNSNSLMNGPFNLNIQGSLELEASSFSTITNGTITMQGSGTVLPVSSTGAFTAYNLNIDATGTYIFSRDGSNNNDTIINNFSILDGSAELISSSQTGKPENFYVGGDVSISNGASLELDVNNAFTLIGNWINSGTATHNSGILLFDGTTTVSGTSTSTFGNTTVNTGKSLTGPSSGTMNISGNLINNGTFTHNDGTLNFNGGTQSISGANPIVFNNLSFAGGSTTTLSTSGNTLAGILKSDGTLAAGGNLTLLSTSSQTALIDGSGSGSVTGSINIQRYLSNSFGYRYISSPYTAATVNEFSTYVNLTANFSPFYRYDEDDTTSGWVDYSTSTNVLTPLHGYAIYFGADLTPLTFTIAGTVSNGSISALTLYNHNRTYTAGFNLVGNPYPSPIDWDASSGWTRTNIDDAIYYFNPSTTDQYGGIYSTYINGVSSDGIANGIISSMQAFFIHVTDGTYPVTASFSTDNNVRINNLSPVFHKNALNENIAMLRLNARYSDVTSVFDPLVIYFNEGSSPLFEKDKDALKLMNLSNDVPSIYALSADSRKLSISSIPYSTDSISIVPIGINTKKDDWVSFYPQNIDLLPQDMQIYLRDNYSGTYHNLKMYSEYEVKLSSGEHNDRFAIVFAQKDIRYKPAEEEIYYAYSFENRVFIYINTTIDSKADVSIIGVTGNEVWRGEFFGKGYHDFYINIKAGVYIIRISSQYGFYTKKLLLFNR